MNALIPRVPIFKKKSQHTTRLDNILTKTVILRLNLNIDGSPITSKSHTHPSHSQTSRLLLNDLVSILRCSSPPSKPVYESCNLHGVGPSSLSFSLSSHRHLLMHRSSIYISFYRLIINNHWVVDQ